MGSSTNKTSILNRPELFGVDVKGEDMFYIVKPDSTESGFSDFSISFNELQRKLFGYNFKVKLDKNDEISITSLSGDKYKISIDNIYKYALGSNDNNINIDFNQDIIIESKPTSYKSLGKRFRTSVGIFKDYIFGKTIADPSKLSNELFSLSTSDENVRNLIKYSDLNSYIIDSLNNNISLLLKTINDDALLISEISGKILATTTKISLIEQNVKTYTNNIDQLDIDVQNLTTNIHNFKLIIIKDTTYVTNIENDINSLTIKVGTIEGNLTSYSGDVGTIEGNYSTYKKNVDILQNNRLSYFKNNLLSPLENTIIVACESDTTLYETMVSENTIKIGMNTTTLSNLKPNIFSLYDEISNDIWNCDNTDASHINDNNTKLLNLKQPSNDNLVEINAYLDQCDINRQNVSFIQSILLNNFSNLHTIDSDASNKVAGPIYGIKGDLDANSNNLSQLIGQINRNTTLTATLLDDVNLLYSYVNPLSDRYDAVNNYIDSTEPDLASPNGARFKSVMGYNDQTYNIPSCDNAETIAIALPKLEALYSQTNNLYTVHVTNNKIEVFRDTRTIPYQNGNMTATAMRFKYKDYVNNNNFAAGVREYTFDITYGQLYWLSKYGTLYDQTIYGV